MKKLFFIFFLLFNQSILAQTISNTGSGGGGVPASAAQINLANYLTLAQLAAAQAGVNTQDLTTPITAWIAACPSTGCQYVVPPGYFYTSTCNFTIPNAFSMLGSGTRALDGTQQVSVIACGSTSVPLFTTTAKVGLMKDFSMIQVGGTAAAGSSAVVIDLGYAANLINFNNLMVDGFYDTFDIKQGEAWHLIESQIQNCVHYCIRVRNTANADTGDWSITDNTFFPANSAQTVIRWESSGGGHITHNKATSNGGVAMLSCIEIETTPGASVQIIIEGNKCEFFDGPAVAIYSGWRLVNIVGNTLNSHDGNGIATFTAAISGSTLTASGSVTGTIRRGMVVTGTGIPKGTYITSAGAGGGVGAYPLNISLQNSPSGISATGSSPVIVCGNCVSLAAVGNTISGPSATVPAILLDTTTSSQIGVNSLSNISDPLVLTGNTSVKYNGIDAFSLAHQPDATKLAAGSTSYVTDAVTPVMGQPFTGGGKLGVQIYSDGARWLAGATILASNYIGPGDVKAGAWGWWGLRAYSAAKAGTKAANICNTVAGDGSCVDINTLANGQLDMVAVAAIPCTGNADCNIKTLYDQTAALNCTGSCDLTQATIAQRPKLIFNINTGLGSNTCNNVVTSIGPLPCAYSLQANNNVLASAGNVGALAQPFSVYGVGAAQFNFATYHTIITGGNGGVWLGNTANNADCVVTADHLVPAVSAQFHNVICVYNGTSPNSFGVVDGATTAFTSAGNFNTATKLLAFSDATAGNTDIFKGPVLEFGVWGSALSASDATNLNNNVQAYYGNFGR